MRKLILLPFYSVVALFSFILFGCSKNPHNLIEIKEYNEYKEFLENKAFEMEIFWNDDKTTYLFASNSSMYISSTKYKSGKEFGYIYDSNLNQLYNMHNNCVTSITYGEEAKQKMKKNVFSSLMLFYTNLDVSKFKFEGKEKILNKDCYKYSYVDTEKNYKPEFTFYIDIETSFCLKATVTTETNTLCFSITKVYSNPDINNYITIVNEFNQTREKED